MAEHARAQADLFETELKPCPEAAVASGSHVFFVDAVHFVFGTFLSCLWPFVDLRAGGVGPAAVQRAGAWDAVTRGLIAVTNTTVVNTESMCQLLRAIVAA